MNESNYSRELFCKNLIYLRGKKSQKEVAGALKISVSALSQYENNKRKPDIDVLISICQYYNVTANTLLGHDLEIHSSKCTIIYEVLQGNRTLANPDVLKKFEKTTLYCYYYSGSRVNVIREGVLKLFSQYEGREFVAGEFESYKQKYFCKLVVEENDHYYVYGTNMNKPDRMVMAFRDHDFLTNSEHLNSGVGLCLSTSSRGRIISQIVVLSSVKIIENPSIPEGIETLRRFMDMSRTTNTGYILSNDMNAELSKWLLQYTPSHTSQ